MLKKILCFRVNRKDIIIMTLKLCILLTFCRILLLFFAPPLCWESYDLYRYIDIYGDVCAATLLVGAVGAMAVDN